MNKIAGFTHRILYDNKFLMIFSFILAIVIWLVVTIALSPIDTAVIKDVPVSIDLTNSVPAQLDLQIFGQADFAVDVEVSGKRYIVNSDSVNADSVKVIAQTAYVDTAGKHTLALKVTKTNENDEFEIVETSEDYIEVYFDVYKELDFPIEPKINAKGKVIKDGYIAGEPILSADTVTVSGPATEVDSIANVFAEMSVDRALDTTKTQAASINAYNENGGALHYLTFNYGNSEITITQPVYYEATKPATVDFKNTPSAYIENGFAYTVAPAEVNVGIQDVDKGSVPDSISIATIDFAELKPGKNNIVVNAENVPSVIFTDGTEQLVVTVNVTGCAQRTFALNEENISYVNVPDGYTVSSLKKSIDLVAVVGPQDSLDKLQASDIYAVVDLKNVDVAASEQTMPAKLSIKNSADCWVSGEYSVVIG